MNMKSGYKCYEVDFHYVNVPKLKRGRMRREFMKHRDEVVEIFNKYIDEVNAIWSRRGKPAFVGVYSRELHPEYSLLIREHIQPHIDELNKKFSYCKYTLGRYGDIVGYSPRIKQSLLWISLKEI